MRYRTHLAATLAVSLPFMVSDEALTVGNLSMLALGALFPDVDEPNSFIGNRLKGISSSIKAVFGHRGLMHSAVGLILAAFAGYTAASALGLSEVLVYWFCVGYFAHLVEDSFSKTGVPWLMPFTKKRIQFGFRVIYYNTGGIIEMIILIVSVLALIHQILHYSLSDLAVFMN